MSDTTWDAWFDEVLPEIPGRPPQALVKNAIRNAAIEFCDRSWVWRVDQEPIPGETDVPDYPLESPVNHTVVVRVLRAWYDEKEIYPKTHDELNELYGHWPSETGTPSWFTLEDPEVLLLVPMPSATLADAITAKLAIKPSRAALSIDTMIYEKYLEEIAFGAKARLFNMSRKPWTDPAAGAAMQSKFDAAIGVAKVQATRGHTRRPLRVKAHFF